MCRNVVDGQTWGWIKRDESPPWTWTTTLILLNVFLQLYQTSMENHPVRCEWLPQTCWSFSGKNRHVLLTAFVIEQIKNAWGKVHLDAGSCWGLEFLIFRTDLWELESSVVGYIWWGNTLVSNIARTFFIIDSMRAVSGNKNKEVVFIIILGRREVVIIELLCQGKPLIAVPSLSRQTSW